MWFYSAGNNTVPVWYYNSRLQVSSFYNTIGNNGNDYLFYESLNWGASTSSKNYGTLLGKTEEVGGPAPQSSLTSYTQNYTCDALNRLAVATDSGGWSRNFAYDQYGNGWVTAASGIGYAASTPGGEIFYTLVNGQKTYRNQIYSSQYDPAGNISGLPPGMTYTYDAENRLTSDTNSGGGPSANYYYDGTGQRVKKATSYGTTEYVYDAFGQLAAEYGYQSAASPCTTCYLSYDYLGTPRLVTDKNANVVARHDYLPFGDEIPGGVADAAGSLERRTT